MTKTVILVALFFLSGGCLFGQLRPFPQNVDYPYGYQTSQISANNVLSAYNRWKSDFIVECNGMYRVCTDDENETRSEGMGYGMLLSAYFGDKGVFDSLFAFYKSKRTGTAYNLMAWQVTCSGITDPGSATDGDLDVAFALIVAYAQWGEDYLDSAKAILSILKGHYFVTCGISNISTMYPGCGEYGLWGGCALTDISYYTPAYFRIFEQASGGDTFWNEVANDAYTILNNGAHATTGLVRDWQSYDGGDPPSGWTDYYRYDACRVPWRMALDYIWNGDVDAYDWCVKISNFANGIGASGIRDGYELDGTVVGTYNNSSFVGGFAVGGMSHSQAMVDNFASRLLTLDGVGWDDTYYNFSLRCLYMLVLTGNFWDPWESVGVEEQDSLLEKFCLKQNYPNPFHTTTTIEYSVAEASHVRLKIYDISGRHIKTLVDKKIPAGKYAARLEADNLLPGVYFYQLKTDKNCIKKRMILLK
jgi:endo-1,4-beta-D-glucanase Y